MRTDPTPTEAIDTKEQLLEETKPIHAATPGEANKITTVTGVRTREKADRQNETPKSDSARPGLLQYQILNDIDNEVAAYLDSVDFDDPNAFLMRP